MKNTTTTILLVTLFIVWLSLMIVYLVNLINNTSFFLLKIMHLLTFTHLFCYLLISRLIRLNSLGIFSIDLDANVILIIKIYIHLYGTIYIIVCFVIVYINIFIMDKNYNQHILEFLNLEIKNTYLIRLLEFFHKNLYLIRLKPLDYLIFLGNLFTFSAINLLYYLYNIYEIYIRYTM